MIQPMNPKIGSNLSNQQTKKEIPCCGFGI